MLIMTDRERLIELLKETEEHPEKTCPHYLEADCFDCPYDRGEDCDREARKADYLLANGVIVPPCKVRDRLYAIFNNKVVKGIAKSLEIVIEENKISYIVGLQFFKGIMMIKGFSFGENIFLTKEEAEAKLGEMNNERKR